MLTRLRSYRASISTPDTYDDGMRNAASCDAITPKLHHHSTFIQEFSLPPWKGTVGNNYQTEPSQSYWLLPGLQGGRKHITHYRNIKVTNIIQFLAIEVKVLTAPVLKPISGHDHKRLPSNFNPQSHRIAISKKFLPPNSGIHSRVPRPACNVLYGSISERYKSNNVVLTTNITQRRMAWQIIMRDENTGNRRVVVATWRCPSNQSIVLSRFAPTADKTEFLEYYCCTSARWEKKCTHDVLILTRQGSLGFRYTLVSVWYSGKHERW